MKALSKRTAFIFYGLCGIIISNDTLLEAQLNKTREITEAGLFAALFAVMIIGSFYIPIIGSLLNLFLPIPMIVLTMKNRPLYVLASGITGMLLSSVVVSLLSGLTLGGMGLIVGLPMGLVMKRKKPNLSTLLVGTVAAAIGFTLTFGVVEYVSGITLIQTVESSFQTSSEIQAGLNSAFEGLGVDTTEATAQSEQLVKEMIDLLRLVMPALMLMFSMFYAAANLAFSHQVLKRLHIEHVPVKPFDQFRYPKHLAYGSMGMMVVAFLLGRMGIVDEHLITANFTYLFTTVFSIQGMALVYYFLKGRSGKGPAIIVIALLVFVGFMNYLSFLGFFDVIMDIRKLREQKNEH